MEKLVAVLLVFLGLLLIVPQTVIASDPDLTTDFNVTYPTAANFTFTFNATEQPKGKALPFFATFNMGLPGLSGLGLSAVVFKFGPYSQVDPHTHPRATEIFFLLEGCVDVGFVDTNNNLFQTTLQAGSLFVFPKGLLHFQRNNQDYKASGFSALSSENAGILIVANALFTSSGTGLPDNVLETALGTNSKTIDTIKKTLGASATPSTPSTPSQGY
jgi:quercetin dioxygenase-like cupin family protein